MQLGQAWDVLRRLPAYRSTTPCARPRVIDLTAWPLMRLQGLGGATVMFRPWGGLIRTIPAVKSRRSRPFQVNRAASGAPRLTSSPGHHFSGVTAIPKSPTALLPLDVSN